MAFDPKTTLNSAIKAGLDGVEENNVQRIIAYLLSQSSGGGGGSSAWGGITGTLSAQTDLQTALNAKLPLAGGTLTGNLLFTDNTLDIGAAGATRPRRGYFGTEVVSPLFTGALTGAASLNVLKAGDTMTGNLLFSPDATHSIGASGANRPTALYLSLAQIVGGQFYGVAYNFLVGGAPRSAMFSGADGDIQLLDSAFTNFGKLQFGGATSAFPSIKRSAALLQCRLADDSAYCDIEGRMLRTATAFTVATLPAAGTQGRIAYVTDSLAPAFLAIAVGGGAIVTTVLDNGTNWVSV